MITYKDITFCLRDCANEACERNKENIKKPKDIEWMPVAFSEFKDCAEWKEKKARKISGRLLYQAGYRQGRFDAETEMELKGEGE